ncbi:programmed cell death protein 2-like [Clinocottus analis]|uniref:programmed cell death protein 2-like n=1 Tax=Clinocottus analis TaxID=304258 RepID=UPI0035BF8CDC
MASPAQELALLGLCDAEVDPRRHRCSFRTSKVGGPPDWPPGADRKCPRCARCGAPLAHVVQVYCPLQGSPYHRNIHLFACTRAACSGGSDSWKVLRSQCLEEEEEEEEKGRTSGRPPPAQEAPLSATEWCDTADDWGMEEEEEEGWGGRGVKEEEAAPETEAGESDVSGRLQDLRLLDPPEDGPPEDSDVPVLRAFFISVVEEADLSGGEEDELQHARRLLREYERREGVVAVGERDDGDGGGVEKYEKTRARHGDAAFSRFLKEIWRCPQQILRYRRGGKPLFVSEPPAEATAPPACGACGGGRDFELQLMPALVSLLRRKTSTRRRGDGEEEAELEFGTVLVYTCRRSCWTEGAGAALEEFCLVQPDPDQQLFK